MNPGPVSGIAETILDDGISEFSLYKKFGLYYIHSIPPIGPGAVNAEPPRREFDAPGRITPALTN